MAEALNLDPKSTALVLIDLQNAIVGRDLKPHASKDVVERSAKLADATRKAGGTVVYVHVLLNEILSLPADKAWPRPDKPLPPETWALVPDAGFQEGTDLLVAKRSWGAFYGTELDQLLRRRGVKTIVIAGIATNMGVESTAREAYGRGYALVFAEDAMSTMAAEWHEFSTRTIFPIMGRVRSTDEIIADFK